LVDSQVKAHGQRKEAVEKRTNASQQSSGGGMGVGGK